MNEIYIGPYGLAKYFNTFFFFFFSVLLVEGNKEELHRIFHFIFLGNALFEFDQKIGSFLKAVLHWDTIIKGRSSFLAFLTLPRNLCQESGKLLTIPLKFMCLVLNSTAYYEQRRNKRCFWFRNWISCAMSYTAISPLPLSNLCYLLFIGLSLIKIYGLILLFQINKTCKHIFFRDNYNMLLALQLEPFLP